MPSIQSLFPVAALSAALALCTPASAESLEDAEKEVREELGERFHVHTVRGLFVVATDLKGESRNRMAGLVDRTYDALYDEFFEVRPTEPIKVYLFRREADYETYCKRKYKRACGTPFGFYVEADRRMVMNISTGGGTLNHELVHPLLETDFPQVPAWFNEGLASLFEGAYYNRKGRLRGMLNWRLPGLQSALRKDPKAVPLRSLMSTTRKQFYDDDSGTLYAAARHLLLYLQRKHLLQRYYEEFKKTAKADPTGITAMETVTGKKLAELEKEWLRWVRSQKYERRG